VVFGLPIVSAVSSSFFKVGHFIIFAVVERCSDQICKYAIWIDVGAEIFLYVVQAILPWSKVPVIDLHACVILEARNSCARLELALHNATTEQGV